MTLFDQIKFAIENKCPIELEYDGKLRRVCPHMLAETKEKGVVCQGYQYAAQSDALTLDEGPAVQGWRYLYLDKMEFEKLTILPANRWEPQPDLTKAEEPPKEWKPPKFVTKVLVLVAKPQ